MIETPDPFLPIYIHDKLTDPKSKIVVRSFRRSDVAAVDYLVKISGGHRSAVETSNDWAIVAKVFEFWTRRWRQEWVEFASSISDIRATRARKDGYSKEKGRAGVRYMGALPPRLMRLIKVIFPNQQWDRAFVDKFIKNIQIVRVGEKVDTWFTLPEAPRFKKDIVKEAVEGLKLNDGNTNKEPLVSGTRLVRNKKRSTSKRSTRGA